MIQKNETCEKHYLASIILSQPLCHIFGAYKAAYFHAKKAFSLSNGDVSFMEYLLFFYDIPEHLFSEDEAVVFAKQILMVDSNSTAAQQILVRFGF